jgi:isochorismate hydrolase
MQRSEIDAIPRDGDISFRQRAIEPDRAALLVIDLQKGLYNGGQKTSDPEQAYLHDCIRNRVIPNGQRLIAACRDARVEVILQDLRPVRRQGLPGGGGH